MYVIIHDLATTLIVLVKVNLFPNSIASHEKSDKCQSNVEIGEEEEGRKLE
jgi:hypothetical protein